MHIEMIAFDADDTLWESEQFYHAAQAAFCELLAAYNVQPETALDILHHTEMENLPVFGYGIRGFTISMIEAAVAATGGRIHAQEIQRIVALGRSMTRHPIHLLDLAAETTTRLAQTHPLIVITKGDHLDQERKMTDSGLAHHFRAVEIVTNKTPETYAALLARHGVRPERFVMVGNAMRSDVLPVLALGGWAVYVPHPLTWVHESGALDAPSPRFFEIAHLGLLPDVIARIEQNASVSSVGKEH